MLKLFKKKNSKKCSKKSKKKNRLRGANELFSSGEIFKVKNKELDNILKELSTDHVDNPMVRHRETIRAVTILTIKNNRYTEKIQNFNFALSVLLIFLSIFTINLARKQLIFAEKQTYYSEVSTRNERIDQAILMKQAYEYCKNNPDSIAPEIFNTKSGEPASCNTVLRSPQFDIYKN